MAAAIPGLMLASLMAGPTSAQDTACAASGVTGGDPMAPCFSGVNDILGGQRYLLASDDLLVSVGAPSGPGDRDTTYINYPFDTELLIPKPQDHHDIAATSCTTPAGTDPTSGPAPLATRLGRIYDLKNDVIVTSAWTVPPGTSSCRQTIFVTDPDGKVLHTVGNAISPEPQMALLDADLDGFDDILMINAANITFHSPADVTDTGSDLVFRFVLSFPSDDYTPRSEVVSGDLNGDGAVDIAWLGAADRGDVEVRLATVCPAAGFVVHGISDTTCTQPFDVVLSRESIATGQTWTPMNGESGGRSFERTFPRMGLTAGDFWGDPDPGTGIAADELVLIKMERGKGDASAFAYSFGGMLEPIAVNPDGTVLTDSDFFPVSIDFYYPVGNPPFVTSGRLDWAERNEQVVAAWSAFPWYGIWVLTFTVDENDKVSIAVNATLVENKDTNIRIRGVAIGRFDPPPPPPDPNPDFNQQIAVLYTEESAADGSDAKTLIDVYRIDLPDSFEPVRFADARTVFLDEILFRNDLPVPAPLQAGDLQGRSLRLGAPEKITIAHTQADTVLGMPPMHVDFISENPGASPPSPPTVFNVSVFPTTFNAQYSTSDSSSAKLSSKSTTSYTYARKESAQAKVSYGIPDIESVSVTAKVSAKQTHGNTVAKQYSTYSTAAFSMTETTEFDDQVTYTTNRMNIYSYPVIGEFVCPAGSPDCPADEKLPLHVQFSGVDNVIHHKPTVASVLPWYQPVQEPGNLFSYPANQQQLSADQPRQGSEPRYAQLAPPESETSSWSSNANEQTTASWTSGGTEQKTASSVSNHSFDASVSVSGKIGIGGFGAKASASYDTSKSTSTSTLNSSTTSFDASIGVSVNQTKVLDTPEYNGETFIFGVKPPEGTLQTDIAPPTDIQGQGTLRVAYAADPLSAVSDVWWRQAYGPDVAGLPDVGLNHPQRWSQDNPTDPTPGAERVWFNCPIGHTSSPTSPDCSPTNASPTPSTVAQAPFYRMKGLFVTPGESTAGPPTNRATVGDTLTLRARIFNFSLTNMPAGTEVHAAFNAQPWDDGGGAFTPASGNADGFAQAAYIGADVLPAIPALCGGAGPGDPCLDNPERNWAFAEITWDTATLDPAPADVSYWKFWVVTWMEQGGELAAELPGHGLTAIPAADLNSLADVPIEPYSNNMGFYNQYITLLPPSADAALVAAVTEPETDSMAGSETEAKKLRLHRLRVRNQRRRSGEPMLVEVKVDSNQPVDDVVVNFYDGNPADDGVLFGAETIPHIAADQPFAIEIAYQRRACVRERLYIEAFSISDDAMPAFARTRQRIRPDLACQRAER